MNSETRLVKDFKFSIKYISRRHYVLKLPREVPIALLIDATILMDHVPHTNYSDIIGNTLVSAAADSKELHYVSILDSDRELYDMINEHLQAFAEEVEKNGLYDNQGNWIKVSPRQQKEAADLMRQLSEKRSLIF